MVKWFKKIEFLIILCVMGVMGCERSTDLNLDLDTEIRLVVEAILTDEFQFQEINISNSYDELNQNNTGVNQADVTVEVNDLVYEFDALGDGRGVYQSREQFAVVRDLEYKLKINWAGNEYQAISRLSDVAPMPVFNFLPYRGGDSLYLGNNIVPLFSATQQSMYRFDVDWSHIHPGLNQARMFYYTFSSVHNSQFIRPEAEDVPFPKGSIVRVTKYGLSDDFAQFLRAQVIETDWNGPILYGNPENALTNISGDGLGFFATCAVLRDTLVAE
jgi:hypothetical protein